MGGTAKGTNLHDKENSPLSAVYNPATVRKVWAEDWNDLAVTVNQMFSGTFTMGIDMLSGTMNLNDNPITNVDSIAFNLTTIHSGSEGDLWWNSDDKTLNLQSDTEMTLQIGQESVVRGINNTGIQLSNGTVVYISGASVGRPEFRKADASTWETSQTTLGITTHDIPDGTQGFATVFGLVRDLDTSVFTEGDIVYLDDNITGAITRDAPATPNFSVQIGYVVTVDASSGSIFFRVQTSDTYGYFNGSFIESFDFLVTSDGATITGSLTANAVDQDLTMRFSSGSTTIDVTPAATITLTAGTDTVPETNYIYIPASTKVLTLSTSSFPITDEHIKVASIAVQTAGTVQTTGALKNQNWNDHAVDENNQGHMSHVAERLRLENAKWESGIAGNGGDDYLTLSASTSHFLSTSGVVYQLHRHIFNDYDQSAGDIVYVVNHDTTPYTASTNLFDDITADSTGASIGNNKYFNLVFWGVANKDGEYQPILINLPSGFYNTQAGAEQDTSGHDNFTIPDIFKAKGATGFLIARLTIQMNATWTYISTVDLRGLTPTTATGGGVGTSVTTFADNVFEVFNVTDSTKRMDFDISGITTATTRTLEIPDIDSEIAVLGGAQTFSGSKTFTDSGGLLLGTTGLALIHSVGNSSLQIRNSINTAWRNLEANNIKAFGTLIVTGVSAFSGLTTWDNNIYIQGKDTGGTARRIFTPQGTDNKVYFFFPNSQDILFRDEVGAIVRHTWNADGTTSFGGNMTVTGDLSVFNGKDLILYNGIENVSFTLGVDGVNDLILAEVGQDTIFTIPNGGAGQAVAISRNVDFSAGIDVTGDSTLNGDLVVTDGKVISFGSPSGSDATHKGHIILGEGIATEQTGIEFYVSGFESGFGHRIRGEDAGGGSTPLIFEARDNASTWTETFRIAETGEATFIGMLTLNDDLEFNGGGDIGTSTDNDLISLADNSVIIRGTVVITGTTLTFSNASPVVHFSSGNDVKFSTNAGFDFHLDENNNGVNHFQIFNGGDVEVFSIDEAGLLETTSLNLSSTTEVSGILDEDDFASDSATDLATQSSIKNYIADPATGVLTPWLSIPANGATLSNVSSSNHHLAGILMPASDSDARIIYMFDISNLSETSFTFHIWSHSNGSSITYSMKISAEAYTLETVPTGAGTDAFDVLTSATTFTLVEDTFAVTANSSDDIMSISMYSDASNANFIVIQRAWLSW